MNIFKKILLFLFGIGLVVFGNRTAINALSSDNSDTKEIDPATSTPLATEEKKPANDSIPSDTKEENKKVEEKKQKKENSKQKNESSPKDEQKNTKDESKQPETTIEPAKTEEATATE